MSNITNVKVYGVSESIVASGFPMLTSIDEKEFQREVDYVNECIKTREDNRHIKRMRKLFNCKSGTGHDNACKGIIVQFDWRTPVFMQPQIQRYHFIDIVSSQSAMHKLTDIDEFKQDDFYGDVYERTIRSLNGLLKQYKDTPDNYLFKKGLFDIILCNLPQSYLKTARYTTNLLQLKTIHAQRRHHKLKQWQEFCNWIESLNIWKLLKS